MAEWVGVGFYVVLLIFSLFAATVIFERLESELEEAFDARFTSLLTEPGLAERLATNIRSLARPGATAEIADDIEEILTMT